MVTGHSMGGAMASFCALDLRVNIYNSLLPDTFFSLYLVLHVCGVAITSTLFSYCVILTARNWA